MPMDQESFQFRKQLPLFSEIERKKLEIDNRWNLSMRSFLCARANICVGKERDTLLKHLMKFYRI